MGSRILWRRPILVSSMLLGVLLTIAALVRLGSTLPSRESTTLEVEWTGCAAELRGPICEIDAATSLTLWLPPLTDCTVDIRLDGKPVALAPQPIHGGQRFLIPIYPGAKQLSAEACGAAWSLPLRPHLASPLLDEINTLRRSSPKAALVKLREQMPELPPELIGVAWGIEARILAATEGVEAAEPAFARAIERTQRDGRLSDACNARLVLSYYRLENVQLTEARAALDAGAECERDDPSMRALWPYFQMTIAVEEPDLRRALTLIDLAIERQERLDLGADLQLSRQQKGVVYGLLGRFDEAASLLKEALHGGESCGRALVQNELGWNGLQAREAGRPVASDAEINAALRASLAEARECTTSSKLMPMVLSNLAFAYVDAGRPDEADEALENARHESSGDDARALPWWLEVEGHIARLRNQPARAEASFRALDSLGVARLDEHARWRAALGLGQTLEQTGDREQAIVAYRQAEASIDAELRLVPFGEARAGIVDARSPSTARLISLLLSLDRAEEAAVVARGSLRRGVSNLVRASQLLSMDATARSRWVGTLAEYRRKRRMLERADQSWRLSEVELKEARERAAALATELRQTLDSLLRAEAEVGLGAPPPGELLLVFHPLEGREWIELAIEKDRTLAVRIAEIDPRASPQRLSSLLLAPVAEALARASTVRILAPSALSEIDFHALPYDGGAGRPLLASKTVVYTLDLGRTVDAAPLLGTDALVARDLTGGLANAEEEAEAVADGLEAQLFPIDGDLAQLIRALETTHHFHYAGHGIASGPDGLESALVISETLSLSSGDVLTLESVPATVVFSGCDLGRTAPARHTLSLGVGQSFVVRGASVVVAPIRPIKDADAAEFSKRLYDALASTGSLARATASAQLALKEERPSVDWAAFRILVP